MSGSGANGGQYNNGGSHNIAILPTFILITTRFTTTAWMASAFQWNLLRDFLTVGYVSRGFVWLV